jgi:hypothetical protein
MPCGTHKDGGLYQVSEATMGDSVSVIRRAWQPNGAAAIDCSADDPAAWKWLTPDGLAPADATVSDLPFGPKVSRAPSKTQPAT